MTKCFKCDSTDTKYYDCFGRFCITCKNTILDELIGSELNECDIMTCSQCNKMYLPEIDSNGNLKNICQVCYRANYCKSKMYLRCAEKQFCSHGIHKSECKCIKFNEDRELFVIKQIECIMFREKLSDNFLLLEDIKNIDLLGKWIDVFLDKKEYRNIKTWYDIFIDLNKEFNRLQSPGRYFSFVNIKVQLHSTTDITDFEKDWNNYIRDVEIHRQLRNIKYGIN